MRRLAWLVLLLATPASAQTGWGPGTPAPTPPASAGVSQPPSPDTNATSSDDAKAIMAPLPVPNVDPNAPPADFIQAAEVALAAGQTGEAEEAIERAEARLLDRDVDPRRSEDPSHSPVIAQLAQARAALSGGDRVRAVEILEEAHAALAGPETQPPVR
jgi:hypothetical protein